MQKDVKLVNVVKSCQTSYSVFSIYLQKSASIQPRTSRSKFADTYSLHANRIGVFPLRRHLRVRVQEDISRFDVSVKDHSFGTSVAPE